jgi:hypothetical protein
LSGQPASPTRGEFEARIMAASAEEMAGGGICQVFCVNDQVFVPGVAVGFAVAVGFGDGLQGKGAVPLPLRPRRLKN